MTEKDLDEYIKDMCTELIDPEKDTEQFFTVIRQLVFDGNSDHRLDKILVFVAPRKALYDLMHWCMVESIIDLLATRRYADEMKTWRALIKSGDQHLQTYLKLMRNCFSNTKRWQNEVSNRRALYRNYKPGKKQYRKNPLSDPAGLIWL